MRRGALLLLLVVLAGSMPVTAWQTDAAPAAAMPDKLWIAISIHEKQLTVYQGQRVLRRYTVATGAAATPTPIGSYRIVSRFSGGMSGFGTCFLGLNVPYGQYGIHGTNKPGSIGSNASHGCVRMRVPDAEALYKLVPNGTLVVIEGGPYGELDNGLRTLRPGDRNSHVMAVQRRLRALGCYDGWPDGVYGAGTQRAVSKARKTFGLPERDLVDWAFYQAIGLTLFE